MSGAAWIVFLLWATQFAGHIAFQGFFTPLASVTWLIVLVFCLFFCVGDVFSLGFFRKRRITKVSLAHNQLPMNPHVFIKISTVFLMFVLIVNSFLFYRQIMNHVGHLNPTLIRAFVIQDFLNERVLNKYVSVFGIISAMSIYLTAVYFSTHNRQTNKLQLFGLLGLGLVSALMTTGRLYLLLFFLSVATIGFLYRKISRRQLFVFSMFFVLLFFSLAFVLKKGDSESLTDSVIWNVQVYGFSSLGCFNNYIETRNQQFDGGLLIPNPMRSVINLLGYKLSEKPVLLPFAWIPNQCNTYTFLYPVYHDLGLWGIAFVAFLIGFFHGYVWRRAKASQEIWWVFLCGISMYPLFMMVFEDAYFSSPGFWLNLFLSTMLIQVSMYLIRQMVYIFHGRQVVMLPNSTGAGR